MQVRVREGVAGMSDPIRVIDLSDEERFPRPPRVRDVWPRMLLAVLVLVVCVLIMAVLITGLIALADWLL